MVELRPDSDDDADARLDHGSTTSTRRWVWALWIVIAIALIALLIVLHLTGTLGAGVHR